MSCNNSAYCASLFSLLPCRTAHLLKLHLKNFGRTLYISGFIRFLANFQFLRNGNRYSPHSCCRNFDYPKDYFSYSVFITCTSLWLCNRILCNLFSTLKHWGHGVAELCFNLYIYSRLCQFLDSIKTRSYLYSFIQ